MTQQEFQQLFLEISSEIADQYYPKNEWIYSEKLGKVVQTERSMRRGEYLRDQALLHVKLSVTLKERGILSLALAE